MDLASGHAGARPFPSHGNSIFRPFATQASEGVLRTLFERPFDPVATATYFPLWTSNSGETLVSMPSLVLDLLYCITSAASGSAATGWLCWSQFHRKALAASRGAGHQAADVLNSLHDLATRVAVDVDEHNCQVKEINETLISGDGREPTKIVDVVAKLIQANQEMQKKLSSTEDQLREQAQRMQTHVTEARTDALTLLANRRALDDELVRQLAEFHRNGRRFAVTMMDVDHFKKFNDSHGHQAGDEVLRSVARVLRRKMRETDLVVRYGGEEFAVVHPGTSVEEACRAASRAREAIEATQVSHNGKEFRVTVSLGVAVLMDQEDGAALIQRADKALYASKEGGRNCVHWHDGQAIHRADSNKGQVSASVGPAKRSEPEPAASEIGVKAEAAPDAPTATKPERLWATLPAGTQELPGRTLFCQQVRNRMAEWRRGGPTFSVALMEVNQYERCDAGRGQDVREAMTRAAAKYFAGTIREMDVLGHYGPGCFALLLPTAELASAIQVAERLREGFAASTCSEPDEQPQLTVSVGVVHAMQKDDSISLLTRAEAALDVAGRRGGNRAYFHDGQRCAPITAMLEAMGYLA